MPISIESVVICALVVFIIAYMVCFEGFKDTVMVMATLDKRMYPVLDKADKEKAANMISELNQFAIDFIKLMRHKFITNPPQKPSDKRLYAKGKQITEFLFDRYTTNSLSENAPKSPEFTSYTYNKGSIISICLREQDSGRFEFHDMQTLKFVFLHELAHVGSKNFSNDHGIQFMADFKFLLHHAREFGIYHPISYQQNNTSYCSIRITYSPLFDDRIDMLMMD